MLKLAVILCFVASFSQGRETDVGGSRARLVEMTESMKTNNQEALNELKGALDRLHGALASHEVAKRDIHDTFSNIFSKVQQSGADNCGEETHRKITGLKAESVEGYQNCTGGTIYRAVGDSVRIATVSLQLFYELFQTLDDVTHRFNDCYFGNSIVQSIECTVDGVVSLGIDTYYSSNMLKSYGPAIHALANDVTGIIHLCQSKNQRLTETAQSIASKCSEQ